MVFFLGQKIFFARLRAKKISFWDATRQIIFYKFNIALYRGFSVPHYFFSYPPWTDYFFCQFCSTEYLFKKKPSPLEVKWSVPNAMLNVKFVKNNLSRRVPKRNFLRAQAREKIFLSQKKNQAPPWKLNGRSLIYSLHNFIFYMYGHTI